MSGGSSAVSLSVFNQLVPVIFRTNDIYIYFIFFVEKNMIRFGEISLGLSGLVKEYFVNNVASSIGW